MKGENKQTKIFKNLQESILKVNFLEICKESEALQVTSSGGIFSFFLSATTTMTWQEDA